MIKDIVVNTRPFNLVPGEVIFAEDKRLVLTGIPTEHFCDDGRSYYTVTGTVEDEVLEKDDFWQGRNVQVYLGDEGCPGYEYDNRPCTMARSRVAHIAAEAKYAEWLDFKPGRSFNADYE